MRQGMRLGSAREVLKSDIRRFHPIMRVPLHRAHETMPWQRTALVELGETNRHAATNGSVSVKLVVGAEEQTFTTL